MKTRSQRLLSNVWTFRVTMLAAWLMAKTGGTAAPVPHSLLHNIPPPPIGAQTGVELGHVVAVNDTYAVCGVPLDGTGGAQSGVVKVFSTATGALLHVIPNPGPAGSDRFGWSLALSGNGLVVGAPNDDTGKSNSGIAYVYDLGGATPTVPILTLENPDAGTDDRFGWSVAISGKRVAIGAYTDDTGAADAGIVYAYDIDSATPTVPEFTVENPNAEDGDSFGNAVALSGARLVVGAYAADKGATDAGRAYVYDLDSATPTSSIAELNNPEPADQDFFGSSVAISGTRVVIGTPDDDGGATNAGRVYVYDLTSPTPATPMATLNVPTPASGEKFGTSVAISGTVVVAGAPPSGLAHVFDVGGATPTVPTFTLPYGSGRFGASVAIFNLRVAVGAPQGFGSAGASGIARLYDLGSGTPTLPTATLDHASPSDDDRFGTSVAISGNLMVVGMPFANPMFNDIGIAYVFDLASATPDVPVVTLNKPSPTGQDWFGNSVAISGTRVVVGAKGDDTGASGAGSAYVFDLASATPTVPVATLNNPQPSNGDGFGEAVAISGTRVVIGEPFDNTGAGDAGSAFVYDLAAPSPTVPVVTLRNPSPAASDYFGISVAISGTRVVVGAQGDNTGASDAGSAYVYDMVALTPTVPVATLNNPSPAAFDYFGSAVAISGTRVVVGAPGQAGSVTAIGAAYVYDMEAADPVASVTELSLPDGASGYNFGAEVAISGTRIVVGAYRASTAYVYDLLSATPDVSLATLNGNPGSEFGASVAVDGNTVAVGAPMDDTAVWDKGYAYVFRPTDAVTLAPVLVSPSTGLSTASPMSISFSLPETALPGSVKLSFGSTEWTLAGSLESAQAHVFLVNPANPTGSPEVASGEPVPDGTYTVTLSYRDTSINPIMSASSTQVLIDTTGPAISPPSGGFAPLAVVAPAAFVDYSAQAVLADAVGVAGIVQSPLPGTAMAVGANAVTLTATDLLGNVSTSVFNVHALIPTQDTDGDGMNDVSELQMAALGFNWQLAQPALVETLFTNANGAGLFTAGQVQTLHVGTPLLTRNATTGKFKLTIGVQKTTDLTQPFTAFPFVPQDTEINGIGELEFEFAGPGDAAFFRLQSK